MCVKPRFEACFILFFRGVVALTGKLHGHRISINVAGIDVLDACIERMCRRDIHEAEKCCEHTSSKQRLEGFLFELVLGKGLVFPRVMFSFLR